jgi:hypothetical protein
MVVKGQIWIENVVYIMIGLTLITVVLSLALPQINKIKDKAIIEQSITALEDIDKVIGDVKQVSGNLRIVEFKNAKGNFYIDGENDQIKYVIEDTRLELSEVGTVINYGEFKLETSKYGSKYSITIYKNYTTLDFKINGDETQPIMTIQPGATNYKLSIENKGVVGSATKKVINFAII